jgi:hypothetical protein
MRALARRPEANAATTSAAEPPRRERNMGSSGRKNQKPTEVRRMHP